VDLLLEEGLALLEEHLVLVAESLLENGNFLVHALATSLDSASDLHLAAHAEKCSRWLAYMSTARLTVLAAGNSVASASLSETKRRIYKW